MIFDLFHLILAIANQKLGIYGVQFHPEVDLTENGTAMLKNFLYDVAKCKGTHSLQCRKELCVKYIRETVGNHKVLVSAYRFVSLMIFL